MYKSLEQEKVKDRGLVYNLIPIYARCQRSYIDSLHIYFSQPSKMWVPTLCLFFNNDI